MRKASIVLATAVVFSVARGALALPPSGLDNRVAEAADAFAHDHRLPGLAVAVIPKAGQSITHTVGKLKLGEAAPVTDRTVFHLASVTKTLVATAVMQLSEKGRIRLDAPVSSYVPDFAMKDPRYRTVTVRQLLSHTGGMPDVEDYHWDHPEYDAKALERYLGTWKDASLVAAPGTEWHYSNLGFELLAHLVATVSGEEFEVYVRRHILDPLDMRHSTLLMTDVDRGNLAWGHQQQDGALVPSAVYPYNRPHAGSSTLHADLQDMLKWSRANLQRGALGKGRILQPASYDLLWTPERDMTEMFRAMFAQAGAPFPYESAGMGLGWFLVRHRGTRLALHEGSDRGFVSYVVLAPDDSAAAVVMANASDLDINGFALTLIDLALGKTAS